MITDHDNPVARTDPFDLSLLCRYFCEHSPHPMIAVEGTTHIIRNVNSAFARLSGQSANELKGHPLADAVPEGTGNGCLALLNRVFSTGVPEVLIEQEHRQAHPRPIYWSYSVWAILGPDEHPVGLMIQVADVTETASFRQQAVAMNEALMVSATGQHRLTEAGRVYSEQMLGDLQKRDHFLAVLSHELRNPLTALHTGLQLLTLTRGDAIRDEKTRNMMERQLKQLVRLVDDLLDISRITTGKLVLRLERIEIAKVLREAAEASRALIDLGGHELVLSLPAVPIMVNADATRLFQVFLNLLNNAAKYSEPGGHIHLSAQEQGAEVVVRIRDTGIGIPADALPHIFEIFVQIDTSWKRAQGGLGIGLSLVKEFVELHGGRVEAHSEGNGKGSEFIVFLPLAITIATELPASLKKQTQGPRRRVLVVDDNRDAAESLAMLLGFVGHDVETAYDGEAGVAAAVQFLPEVVLMDLGMPKVDGYEAARRIRAKTWDTRPLLVALTGWGADDDRLRTYEAGFDRHLVKPVDLELLQRMIAEIPPRSQ